MRELKFRAWDGSQMLTEENFDFVVSDYNSIIKLDEHGWTEHWVDCVEQYTGLKDKNGREIYEGDTVEEEIDCGDDDIDGTYRYTVVWDEDTLCWSLSPQYGVIHKDLWETNSSVEVIGNIHENPELLKEEE